MLTFLTQEHLESSSVSASYLLYNFCLGLLVLLFHKTMKLEWLILIYLRNALFRQRNLYLIIRLYNILPRCLTLGPRTGYNCCHSHFQNAQLTYGKYQLTDGFVVIRILRIRKLQLLVVFNFGYVYIPISICCSLVLISIYWSLFFNNFKMNFAGQRYF